jgi:D-alanyl-D-alanine carboxypeptidase
VWWPRDRPAIPASSDSAPPASRALTDPAVLQQQLDGVVEAGAPGVVGLIRIGERTWQGASGLGDLRGKRRARAGDRFRIGSVTKSFVAMVVLQLVEGRLRLGDNLERWLPGLVPGGERITVRQLLNHTSGLYNYTDDLPEPPRRVRPRQLVAIATGHRPLFAPGTEFSYSNTNYILAGLLAERVTGQRLADQLEQRILQPLGLDDTGARRIAGGLSDDGLQHPDANRQLVMVTNLQPEPEPGAATAAVENILRREVSC